MSSSPIDAEEEDEDDDDDEDETINFCLSRRRTAPEDNNTASFEWTPFDGLIFDFVFLSAFLKRIICARFYYLSLRYFYFTTTCKLQHAGA